TPTRSAPVCRPPPPTPTPPLALHAALPTCPEPPRSSCSPRMADPAASTASPAPAGENLDSPDFSAHRTSRSRRCSSRARQIPARSEEHTSELQSRENLVCRLLLEKKKQRRR